MYAAMVTGALAVLLTGLGLFLFTGMVVHKILFWSMMAYAVGIAAVLWITEPKADIKDTKETAYGEFKIFDLKNGTEFSSKR